MPKSKEFYGDEIVGNINKSFNKYIRNSTFFTTNDIFSYSAWERPIRVQDLTEHFFEDEIKIEEITSNKSLISQRVLLNIYEQDMLFLPNKKLNKDEWEKFNKFYSEDLITLGNQFKHKIESKCFQFLESEIIVSTTNWTQFDLEIFFNHEIKTHESSESEVSKLLLKLEDKEYAKLLLVQMAPDFLSEASAMCRSLPGSYGKIQSELMKIFIDEYGYGVHEKKHSKLFEQCMNSVDLNSNIHYYHFFYLPTSYLLTNYFHYVCLNKRKWFQYLGALYYTEATIPHFNKQLSKSFKKIFGKEKIDTEYFDEHVHIDKYHKSMVLNELIIPSIKTYGDLIIPDIIRGFEEFKLLQNLADSDFLNQAIFDFNTKNFLNSEKYNESTYKSSILNFSEEKGCLSYSHIHDQNEFFEVIEGELEFFISLTPILLKKGDSLLIPKGRLHGTRIISDKCLYKTRSFSIKEKLI